MAKLICGSITGILGGIEYYTGKHGETRERANTKKFDNLTKRAIEFGRALHAVNCFTNAFSTLIANAADVYYEGRLQREMLCVLRSDMYGPKGSRTIMDGDIELLEGFECNEKQELPEALRRILAVDMSRSLERISLHIPVFDPAEVIPAIEGAMYFIISSAAAAINFETGKISASKPVYVQWLVDEMESPAITMAHTVDSERYDPWFLMVGLQMMAGSRGRVYPLRKGGFSALRLVEVGVRKTR